MNIPNPLENDINRTTRIACSDIIDSISAHKESIAQELIMLESGDGFESTSRYLPFTVVAGLIMTKLLENASPELTQHTNSVKLKDYLAKNVIRVLDAGTPFHTLIDGIEVCIEKQKGYLIITLIKGGQTDEHFYNYSPTNLAVALAPHRRQSYAGSNGRSSHSTGGLAE